MEETSGDSGVEILKNEPYENEEMGKGQYTYKIYHLGRYGPASPNATFISFISNALYFA